MPPPAARRPLGALLVCPPARGRPAARLPQASGSAPCSPVLGRRSATPPDSPRAASARAPRGRLRAPRRRRQCLLALAVPTEPAPAPLDCFAVPGTRASADPSRAPQPPAGDAASYPGAPARADDERPSRARRSSPGAALTSHACARALGPGCRKAASGRRRGEGGEGREAARERCSVAVRKGPARPEHARERDGRLNEV
jgi:hypothetical protein